ncbi:MAG: alkaline phosphatase family protein, partial [Armatimonadota bacterium]
FFEGGIALWPADRSRPRLLQRRDFAFTGRFTKDGKRFVVSNGDAGHGIEIYDTAGWDLADTSGVDGRFAPIDRQPLIKIEVDKEAYINDLVLAPDGKTAFGVDVARQKVVAFDLAAGTVLAQADAGREPYACALSPDGRKLLVANIGIFNYSLIPPPAPGSGYSKRGLAIPAFGFPSKEAREGVEREGRKVPGLGDPRVPDAQSVWAYDVSNPAKPTVTGKAKTGILIHAPADGGKAVGGSAPNALLVRGDQLYVSNANNDTVQIFDRRTLRPVRTIKLAPTAQLQRLRGVIPTDMALNRAGDRLYVCEAGLNAVAVIDPRSGTVLGHIPSGWFPTRVLLAPDEKTVMVATQKGLGRGPRGAKHRRPETDERAGLPDMPGMVQVVAVPDAKALAAGTAAVLRNNGLLPIAAAPKALPKDVEYVVFITKENHTFDGIFGTLENSDGEPDYAEFGERGWIREKGRTERVPIMPNHLKLARQFAVSDNFYMEPDASGDGHRWLVGVYPSLWTSRVFYSGWAFSLSESAKGRMVSFGSNGSQIPEDYLENGSLWEHLARGGVSFRNYGEGYELTHNDEGKPESKTGAFTLGNYPMPKVLYDNTCFEFPAYNNNIPDIARADWFREDLDKYRKSHGGKIPKFLNIAICNDHGAGPNASRGYPYVSSYMADNDLALGRIVEYLSRQPEWRKMAIFVTQDDSGGDGDHVDRHRSFVLAIGPWIKKHHVSHDHTSIMSILKTIYRCFGLGPNNLFDAVANDLSDMFTDKPDYTPYTHVPSDPRVFKPEETFDPSDPKFTRRRGETPTVKMDDPRFIERMRRGGELRRGTEDEDEDDD